MDRGKCHFLPSYSYTSSSCTVGLLLHLQYYQRCEAIIFKMSVFLFLRKPYFYNIFTKRGNKTYVFKGLFILITHCYCKSQEILFWYHQKQPSRGVHKRRCSENMQQIFGRTPMPKCDFNKVALLYYLITSLLQAWK